MACLALLAAVLGLSRPAWAGQTPSPAAPDTPNAASESGQSPTAWVTRNELNRHLQRHPPEVGQVLALDPALLSQATYMSTYPELADFIGRHPEIARNPGFFFGDVRPFFMNRGAMGVWGDVMMGALALLAFVSFLTAVGFLARSVIEHRRWTRASRVQVEAHGKLLDRFSANADLLAYMQTPAGRRFLEATPIAVEPAPRTLDAPVGRILWSVQAGLVLAVVGIGLGLVSRRMEADAAQGFNVIAVLALSLGVGFILSSGVSYLLSRRLGLIEAAQTAGGGLPPRDAI